MASLAAEAAHIFEAPSIIEGEKSNVSENSREISMEPEALSNALILRSIFRNLPFHDLEVCSNVNQVWRNEAELRMHQFNVQFFYSDMSYEETIIIQEVIGLQRDTKKYKLDFDDLIPTVKKALNRADRVRIALHMNRIDISNPKLIKFVKTFGHFVFRLNYEVSHLVSFQGFSNFVCKYLPNLEEMHMDEFWFGTPEEELALNDTPSHNKQLRELKMISFFKQEPPFEKRMGMCSDTFKGILDLAPNLETIECFPLERVDVLGETGKAKLVQGIQYPHHSAVMGHEVRSWLKKLANLKPRLKFFDLPRSPRMLPRNQFQLSKRELYSIMESSRKTLEHIVIFPTQKFNYLKYPSGMSAVRILELANESNYCENSRKEKYLEQMGISQKYRKPWRRFFPARVDVRKIFPNLEQIRILLEDIKPENFHLYFPFRTFQQFHVTHLYVNNEASTCLTELAKLFHYVTNLTVDITFLKVKGLEKAVEKMNGFLQLREIVLEIDSHQFFDDSETDRHCEEDQRAIFDSVITGIPENICELLRSKLDCWNGNVEGFRTGPNLLAIKGLKSLDFVFSNKLPHSYLPYRWWWHYDCFPVLLFSEVSCEFGFRKYSQVNVSVKVEDEHSSIDTGMMLTAMGPAVDFVDLHMNYHPPFYIKTNFPT